MPTSRLARCNSLPTLIGPTYTAGFVEHYEIHIALQYGMLIAWCRSWLESTRSWRSRLTVWWTAAWSGPSRRQFVGDCGNSSSGERRQTIGAAIVEGYRRIPQTGSEAGWTDDSARSMIAEEPW